MIWAITAHAVWRIPPACCFPPPGPNDKQTAIFSTNFCTSAKNAFYLIARNIARVAAVTLIGEFILTIMTVRRFERDRKEGVEPGDLLVVLATPDHQGDANYAFRSA